MTTVLWLVEGSWEACVDAARRLGLADVVLVHVVDEDAAAGWSGAAAGLFGRGAARVDTAPFDEAGAAVLGAAVARLGGAPERRLLHGRVEPAVLDACAGAELLVCARDGDRARRGPHNLGRETRYVLDHAPCDVLLVWPGAVPAGVDLPPAP